MTTTSQPTERRPQTDIQISVSVPPVPAAPAAPLVSATPEDGDRARGERGVAEALAQRIEGANLLLADVRTAFILVNHARHRVLERLFGTSPEQANAVTVIGLLLLAETVHDKMGRLLKAPASPAASDGLLAGAALRELLGSVAGPAVRDSPGLSTLVTLAFVASTARPAAVRSLRALRSSSHRLSVEFHNRYGYLVDPGHWRQRRARRGTTQLLG